MDIKHLRYFISIVENNFNLSRASQHLYISQPALSMMINDFEQKENVKIFERTNGKIVGLTYIGEGYYQDTKELLEKHNSMHQKLHHPQQQIKGEINIGIPPLILSVLFSSVLPKLMSDNRNIKITIKEKGAYALKNELLLGHTHLATLLNPEQISQDVIDSFEIYRSELAIFCSPEHKLAKKEVITWKDLHKEQMIIFDKSFMIYQHLREAFERHHVYPDILCESSSWDYLYYTAKSNKNILTILPLVVQELHHEPNLVCRKVQEPVLWKVTLCRLKKNSYSNVEKYIFDELLRIFQYSKH